MLIVELLFMRSKDEICRLLTLDSIFCLKARSSASSSGSKVIDHFIAMGFDAELVSKAIQENGKDSYVMFGQ